MDPWADRKRDYSGNEVEQLETLGADMALERVRLRYSGGIMYQISRYSSGGSQHLGAGKTEPEARASWAALLSGPRCRECGNPEPSEYIDSTQKQIQERGLCFRCNFWTNMVAGLGPHSVIVEGRSYEIAPDRPDILARGGQGLGHGGAAFEIAFNDGRTVVSRNLWAQGEIPAHFRERMPDNARFVRREPKAAYIGSGSASI